MTFQSHTASDGSFPGPGGLARFPFLPHPHPASKHCCSRAVFSGASGPGWVPVNSVWWGGTKWLWASVSPLQCVGLPSVSPPADAESSELKRCAAT